MRAIRVQAQVIDPNPAAYAIAIVSYLVRFASFDNDASVEERALAYELACRLVAAVERDLGGARRERQG